jgi:hypothetical protein
MSQAGAAKRTAGNGDWKWVGKTNFQPADRRDVVKLLSDEAPPRKRLMEMERAQSFEHPTFTLARWHSAERNR